MFYLVFNKPEDRTKMIQQLKEQGIMSVFHYQSLHKSSFYQSQSDVIPELNNSDRYTECLLRLPLYYELTEQDVDRICTLIN